MKYAQIDVNTVYKAKTKVTKISRGTFLGDIKNTNLPESQHYPKQPPACDGLSQPHSLDLEVSQSTTQTIDFSLQALGSATHNKREA